MNPWRDRFWDLFHLLKAEEVFVDQLLLLVDYDKDLNVKRKYDGFINGKQEERKRRRDAIDTLVLGLPQGE